MFRSECLLKLLLSQRGVGDQEAAKQRWSAAVRMEYQNRTKDANTGVFLIRETRDVAQQPNHVADGVQADPKPLLPHMGSFLEPEPDHESQSSRGSVVFSPAEDPPAKRHCGLLRTSSMISITTVATEVASASASSSLFSPSHVDPTVQLASIPTPQGMWSHCRKDLQSCHKNFLIHLVEKDDAKISELKGTIRTLNKQLVRLNASKASLELQLQQSNTDEDNQIDTALDVSRIGVVKLSSRGTIALGLRKSLALTSAAGFPLASLVDVSRYTVVKAEISCWAGIVALSRAFNRICRHRLEQAQNWLRELRSSSRNTSSLFQIVATNCGGSDIVSRNATSQSCLPECGQDLAIAEHLGLPTSLSLESMCGGLMKGHMMGDSDLFFLAGTEFAGDATNSNIWQQSKLAGLLVTSLLMTDHDKLKSVDAFHKAFSCWRTVILIYLF